MSSKGTNPKEDIKLIYNLYQLYNKIKPDLVLHYTIKPNIYGNIACRLLKIKTINNISGLGTVFIKKSFITQIVKLLYKYALKSSLKVFFQNQDDREVFLKNQLVKKEVCGLLPGSGIDLKKFQPIKVKRNDSNFKFLLIARLLWDKGISEYINAVREVKKKYTHVDFLIIGAIWNDNRTAISEKEVKAWEEEGIIKYLGTTDNIKEEIAKVNCVVLPSYREGTPRTLLEAAAMEKPIITTDVPGCREVVDDGVNGYLCKVKDYNDLAKKMEKILNLSKNSLKEMGKKGKDKMINEFDEQIVINKYLETIKNINI
jgi:glycosyltransferase involved in cell wall biosynthesis